MAMQLVHDQLAATDADRRAWSFALPSVGPDDTNSLGLFLSSQWMDMERSDLSTSVSWPLLQPPSVQEAAMGAPRTLSVDRTEPIRQNLGHAPGTVNQCTPLTMRPPTTETVAETTALQQPRTTPAVILHPQPSGSNLPPSDFKTESRAMLPPNFTDIVMIIDRNDMIIGTSTSLRACASMLYESNLGSVNKNAGWHPLKLLYKFSHLLADEHAIHCWQQACRFIQASLETSIRAEADTECNPERHHREMVLKRRSQGDSEELIEVKVMAMNDDRRPHDDHLMVQIRPLTLPSVAAVSSNASAQPQHTYLSTKPQSFPQQVELDTELRLLVSRSGLILGTSCSNTSDPDACTRAILGQTVQPPLFGQSLVEVAQLVPLVHVVAQAAVVGLARTVGLSRADQKVQARVQPVLRSAKGARSSVLPAAKVWITLSAASGGMRRFSSTSSSTNHHTSSSERQGSAAQRLGAGSNRRHSEQLFSSASSFHPLSCPQAAIGHEDWPAFMSQPHLRAPERQQQRVREPTLLEDSLSPHVRRLREENRILRAQLQAHLRKRHWTMQQQRGSRIQ